MRANKKENKELKKEEKKLKKAEKKEEEEARKEEKKERKQMEKEAKKELKEGKKREKEAAKEAGKEDSLLDQAGDALELAGEVCLDVVTGGVYGLTVGAIDAADGLDEADKERKAKGEKVSFGEQCDIVADAFTGGLYSALTGSSKEKDTKDP